MRRLPWRFRRGPGALAGPVGQGRHAGRRQAGQDDRVILALRVDAHRLRQACPAFGDAQSLSNDEVYAVAAYLLFLNDIVDEDFELTKETFRKISMPNERGFHDDDRETTERAFWNPNPCMTDCKTDIKIIDRARILDVTPAARPRRQAID